MVSVRAAKSKGSQFEYSVFDSLKPVFSDILLTKQLGFVSQYDLISKKYEFVVECKKHKGFSWNELKKYYDKLKKNAPEGYNSVVIFQANRQPCLVMLKHEEFDFLIVVEFKEMFGVPFIKHTGGKKI